MASGKSKLLFSFAILGFFVGSAAYFGFEWLTTNNMMIISSVPITQVLFAPWLISGVAGAVLSLIAISVFSHFSTEK